MRTTNSIDRALRLAAHLYAGGEISTATIRERFQVSKATAKRDLVYLECALPVSVREIPTRKNGPPRKVLRLMQT